jgi:hypothetical protein
MQYFDEGDQCVIIVGNALIRNTNHNPYSLYTPISEHNRKPVSYKHFKIFDDIGPFVHVNELMPVFNQYKIDPINMMSRYAQMPHIDFASPSFVPGVTDENTIVDTYRLSTEKIKGVNQPQ